MRRLSIFVTLSLIASGCPNSSSRTPMTVTYVSNCGFLLEAGDHKLIIDGLLAGFDSPYYYLPNDSITDLMRWDQEPFEDIDLILVTHVHHDHFDAQVVAEHMLHDTAALLLGPPQVREKLKDTEPYAQIQNRVYSVPSTGDTAVPIQLAGMNIKVLPSEHAPYMDIDSVTGKEFNRHADIEHLEYVVDLGDRVVYHCGDAAMNDRERYRSFGFGDTTLDLAMVDWWDARKNLSFTQMLIRDIIRPECVVMMHMFPGRRPRGEPQKQTTVAPRVILPDSLMQQWTLE